MALLEAFPEDPPRDLDQLHGFPYHRGQIPAGCCGQSTRWAEGVVVPRGLERVTLPLLADHTGALYEQFDTCRRRKGYGASGWGWPRLDFIRTPFM